MQVLYILATCPTSVAIALACRQEEAESLGLPTADAEGAEGGLAAAAPLALSCWRGCASLKILVAKPDCEQLAEKLRFAAKRRVQCVVFVDIVWPHAAQSAHQQISDSQSPLSRCQSDSRLGSISSFTSSSAKCLELW